jgi:hypothetical protein
VVNYFIANSFPQLPAWKILIDMLNSSKEEDKQASVRCLQLLTNHNKKYWNAILDAGGIEKLFEILKRYAASLLVADKAKANEWESITLNAITVLCNLSDQMEIKQRLSGIKDLLDCLIKVINHTSNVEIQSGIAILLADISSIDEENKERLANLGCLDRLLQLLLNSDVEDLLVNTVNAIEILCLNNVKNQNYCCENGIFLRFIDLLELNSGKLPFDFLLLCCSSC